MNKVLIAVPTAGYSKNDAFYDYWSLIDKPPGTICTFARGQSPARNRNLMIEQALLNDCTHILFLDDDTCPPSDILTKLIAHDKDAVTGLYLMRSFPHRPIMFAYTGDNGTCAYRYLKDEEEGLIPLVNAGLGACLIKIEVFKKLDSPWIRLGEVEVDHWCDDIGFFNRFTKAGFQLFCDLSVKIGHMTQVIVKPEFIDGKWNTSYNTVGERNVLIPQLKEGTNFVS